MSKLHRGTYVLLNVLLSMLKSGLSELRGHLGSRIIHELPIRTEHIPARPSLLLIRIPALWLPSVALLLALRRAWWRRW